MAESGARNVLIANQIVGQANIRRVAQLIGAFPTTRFLVLVDSVAGLDQLIAHGVAHLPFAGAGLACCLRWEPQVAAPACARSRWPRPAI